MSIKLGTIEVNKTYSGGTQINKMYLGDTVVFGGGGGADPYGPELIVNGDFITDSDWSKGVGWSINTVDNRAELDGTNTGSSLLQQSGILTVGVLYEVSFTVTGYVSGSFYARLGFSGSGTPRSANGTFVQQITCSGNANFDILALASSEFFITNISVKEVL